jgi:hypothetical protein
MGERNLMKMGGMVTYVTVHSSYTLLPLFYGLQF